MRANRLQGFEKFRLETIKQWWSCCFSCSCLSWNRWSENTQRILCSRWVFMKWNEFTNFCLITVMIKLNSTLISYEVTERNIPNTMESIMRKKCKPEFFERICETQSKIRYLRRNV
jgi:hypothetical protein